MIGKNQAKLQFHRGWTMNDRWLKTGRPDQKNWSLGSLAFQDGIGLTYNFYIEQVTIALLIICNKLT